MVVVDGGMIGFVSVSTVMAVILSFSIVAVATMESITTRVVTVGIGTRVRRRPRCFVPIGPMHVHVLVVSSMELVEGVQVLVLLLEVLVLINTEVTTTTIILLVVLLYEERGPILPTD